MPGKKQKDEHYSEDETVRRREAAIKRMLRTPHKPHKTIKPPEKSNSPKKPEKQ